MLPIILTTVVLFALAMAGLGIGLLVRGRELQKGCCGGTLCGEGGGKHRGEHHHHGPDGERCDDCPDRETADAAVGGGSTCHAAEEGSR